jgi:hypothetical protein
MNTLRRQCTRRDDERVVVEQLVEPGESDAACKNALDAVHDRLNAALGQRVQPHSHRGPRGGLQAQQQTFQRTVATDHQRQELAVPADVENGHACDQVHHGAAQRLKGSGQGGAEGRELWRARNKQSTRLQDLADVRRRAPVVLRDAVQALRAFVSRPAPPAGGGAPGRTKSACAMAGFIDGAVRLTTETRSMRAAATELGKQSPATITPQM